MARIRLEDRLGGCEFGDDTRLLTGRYPDVGRVCYSKANPSPSATGSPTMGDVSRSTTPHERRRQIVWSVVALLMIIPFAAILHHAVFYRPTCMLNPFGPDYSFEVVVQWLRNDPSVPLAVVLAVAVWVVGLYRPEVRPWAVAFFLAFLPLSIWIWDIPFSGRVICRTFHDARTPLRSLHFYLLGIGAFLAFSLIRLAPRRPRHS